MNVITVIIVIFDAGKGEWSMILFEKNDSGTCKRDAVASIGFVLPRRRAYCAKGLPAPGTPGEREVFTW